MKKQAMDRLEGIRIVPEEKPSKDAKSNPDAESANNIAEGLIRCHKAQLDEALGEKIPSDHPIVAWLMIHCGVLYNISHVGSDGLTPFERARGRRMASRSACLASRSGTSRCRLAGARRRGWSRSSATGCSWAS